MACPDCSACGLQENVGLRAAVGTPAKKRAGAGTPGTAPAFLAASLVGLYHAGWSVSCRFENRPA